MDEGLREKLLKNIYEKDDGLVINIYVKHESAMEKLVLENDDLVYYTIEPHIKGRENAALIRFLSRVLGLPISKIHLIYGAKKTLKAVLIRDIDLDKLVNTLIKYIKHE